MLVVLEVLMRAHLTVGKRRRGRGLYNIEQRCMLFLFHAFYICTDIIYFY